MFFCSPGSGGTGGCFCYVGHSPSLNGTRSTYLVPLAARISETNQQPCAKIINLGINNNKITPSVQGARLLLQDRPTAGRL